MELPIKIVVLVVGLLIVFAISIMFVTSLGQSGGASIDSLFKWLFQSAKF